MIPTMILAAISIGAPDTATTDPVEPPPAMEWPDDLPRQIYVPEGRHMPDDTRLPMVHLPAGRLLPELLADHVMRRLKYLDELPDLCGVKLRGLDEIRRGDIREATRVCEATCRTRIAEATAEASEGYAWWIVVGWTAGGMAFGVIAGIVLGIAAGL